MIIVDSDNNLDCYNMNYNDRSVNNDQFVTCNNAHIALNELKIVCIASKEKFYFSSFTVIYNNVCDDIKNDNILLTYRHQRWPLGYGCEITYWWGTSKISKTVKCLAK